MTDSPHTPITEAEPEPPSNTEKALWALGYDKEQREKIISLATSIWPFDPVDLGRQIAYAKADPERELEPNSRILHFLSVVVNCFFDCMSLVDEVVYRTVGGFKTLLNHLEQAWQQRQLAKRLNIPPPVPIQKTFYIFVNPNELVADLDGANATLSSQIWMRLAAEAVEQVLPEWNTDVKVLYNLGYDWTVCGDSRATDEYMEAYKALQRLTESDKWHCYTTSPRGHEDMGTWRE